MTGTEQPTKATRVAQDDAKDAPSKRPDSPGSISEKVISDIAAPPKPVQAQEKDSAQRIKTDLADLQSGSSRGQWAIEADLRQTVLQHTKGQLGEIDKLLGGKLDDLAKNPKLSSETRTALAIYLHGSDNRSPQDTTDLIHNALTSKNLELFSEAARGASPSERNQFMQTAGDARLRGAFGDGVEYKQAHDLATFGHVSALTKVWADRSGVWTNWSDDKGIDGALRTMPADERKLYLDGGKIASGQTVDGLSAQDAQRARQYYNDLNTEIEKAGNSTQVAAWKAMAADGGAQLYSQIAAQHGVLWNGSRGDLSSAIEGMSPQDWQYFKDPAHKDQRRADLERILSTVAGEGDVKQLMSQFDNKMSAPDFAQSQATGQRGILQALQDNTHWYHNDRPAVVDAIAHMSPEDQKRYHDDETFRKQVDDGVKSVLKDGDSLKEAQRLLQMVHDGKQPTEDILTKLRKNASSLIGDGEQSLHDIQDAFEKDPALRESVIHPNEQQRKFSDEFKEAARNAVGGDEQRQAMLDELLTKGALPTKELVGLNNGWITNDYSRALQDLANLPQAERQNLVSDEGARKSTIGFMNAEQQKAAVEVLKQGSVRPEDQIYTGINSTGHSSDIMDALRKLQPDQLEQVRKEYTRKYGGDLDAALKNKLTGTDLTEANRIMVSDKDARTQIGEARDEYYSTRSGFGSWFSDHVIGSGTGLTADDAALNGVSAVADANKNPNAQSDNVLNQRHDQLIAAVDNHRESKDAIASNAADAAIGAVAIGTSIATFGGAVPFWAGVGGTMVAGAGIKTFGTAAFKGNDYDWSAGNMFKDATIGAVNAGTTFLAPTVFGPVTRGGFAGFMERRAVTFGSGLVGGGISEAVNGATQWDPRKSTNENLSNVFLHSAEGGLSTGIGALALDGIITGTGRSLGMLRRLRPEVNRFPQSLSAARSEINDPIVALEKAVREGKVERTFDDHDAHVQVIVDPQGAEHQVVMSVVGPLRMSKELSVQELHRMSPFISDFPATVDIGNGRMAQTYMGRSLENLGTRNVQQLYSDSAEFRESLDQAMVERLIYGDLDSHLGNFTLNDLHGQMRVANIDVEQAFSWRDTPDSPNIEFLRGRPLSVETLGRIQSFVRTIEGSREQLRELNLTDRDIDHMVERARWFLENQTFPIRVN